MLKINDKIFMNLQEAVQWLLDNNALPFQCSANYIANTEIGLGTIDNPSPAKVKIGSLILFADSKIATVSGLTENGFMVGTQNIDIKNALAYISSIGLNASGYIITTLSDGTSINAGQVKQVSYFSIDASQHLIVYYNDGTSTDLGAIFSGNINVSGDLSVSGKISGGEIVEDMAGYSFSAQSSDADVTISPIYAGVVKNGNKLTFVTFASITRAVGGTNKGISFGFTIPSSVASKLIPYQVGGSYYLDNRTIEGTQRSDYVRKTLGLDVTKSGSIIYFTVFNGEFTEGEETYIRIEQTFLLSDNMAS